jgi:hypothetical protein
MEFNGLAKVIGRGVADARSNLPSGRQALPSAEG